MILLLFYSDYYYFGIFYVRLWDVIQRSSRAYRTDDRAISHLQYYTIIYYIVLYYIIIIIYMCLLRMCVR